jgi:hypothetical protein
MSLEQKLQKIKDAIGHLIMYDLTHTDDEGNRFIDPIGQELLEIIND